MRASSSLKSSRHSPTPPQLHAYVQEPWPARSAEQPPLQPLPTVRSGRWSLVRRFYSVFLTVAYSSCQCLLRCVLCSGNNYRESTKTTTTWERSTGMYVWAFLGSREEQPPQVGANMVCHSPFGRMMSRIVVAGISSIVATSQHTMDTNVVFVFCLTWAAAARRVKQEQPVNRPAYTRECANCREVPERTNRPSVQWCLGFCNSSIEFVHPR